MLNRRLESLWKSICVIDDNGSTHASYQLDRYGRHISKFKKLPPRDIKSLLNQKKSIYQCLPGALSKCTIYPIPIIKKQFVIPILNSSPSSNCDSQISSPESFSANDCYNNDYNDDYNDYFSTSPSETDFVSQNKETRFCSDNCRTSEQSEGDAVYIDYCANIIDDTNGLFIDDQIDNEFETDNSAFFSF